MRKIQFILCALVMFQFACEPQEDPAPGVDSGIDYDRVSDGFQEMFEGAFSMTESLELVSVVDRTDELLTIRIEAERMSKATKKHFGSYFMGIQPISPKHYLPVPPFSSQFNGQSGVENLLTLIDTSGIFNTTQKLYIKSLTREIMIANSSVEGINVLSGFREQVVSSEELGESDKIMLLQIVAGSQALLEFLEKGGEQMVWDNLATRLSNDIPMGRTMTCSVDWRSVWMDGVVGLVGGAVWGGYTGATAGTFTVPILGTVAGAVGGAVFGGASGFISGVSYGIVSDLLTTCFRPQNMLQQTYASCDLAWNAYMNNEINELPAECFEISFPVKSLLEKSIY